MSRVDTPIEGGRHTPGPWALFRDAYGGGLFIDTALGTTSTNGMVVAGQIHGSQREANAAFIVRACNSHYDLLEALEGLLAHWTSASGPADWDSDNTIETLARAAIAKAKGHTSSGEVG